MFGSPAPVRLKVGLVSTVKPPSTSLSPKAPLTTPMAVTQQLTPAPGVWSSSGWAAVPTGFPLAHWPVVAAGEPAVTVQPVSVSMLSERTVVWLWKTVAAYEAAGAAAGSLRGPAEVPTEM